MSELPQISEGLWERKIENFGVLAILMALQQLGNGFGF